MTSTAESARIEYLNPQSLARNPAFTNVVAVSGNVKMIYVGGQDAVSASGAIVGQGDMRAQAEQIFINLKAALAAAGAGLEHVVKWTIYVVNGQSPQPAFEVFQREWGAGPIRRRSLWRLSPGSHVRNFWRRSRPSQPCLSSGRVGLALSRDARV